MTKIMWGIIDSKKIYLSVEINTIKPPFATGPAYYVLHPQKVITICVFFNLPSLKKPGRNRFWKKSLIGEQGVCPYIFFSSFSKLF